MKSLPAEDDRFEYKENLDIEKISQEICAFANSFGGTLFLGVEDKNNGIKGIDRVKGNSPTTLYLEQIIPTRLEFRFGSFRVREVKLALATQERIGSDKAVVSIDVFDSDMAPYQVVRTRKYYRRENSSSIEAPHSYLAYLWSRNSSEKTTVVQYWIRDFLTPLISALNTVVPQFRSLEFPGSFVHAAGNESFWILRIVDLEGWQDLWNKLSANQFLRIYEGLRPQVDELSRSFRALDSFIDKTIKDILEDEDLQNVIRARYKTYLSNQHPTPPYDSSKPPLQMLATLLATQELPALANSEPSLVFYASRFLVYALFNFKMKFSTWKDESFWNFCVGIIDELKDNNGSMEQKKQEMDRLKQDIVSIVTALEKDGDILRHELCLRHNTTY